MQKILYVQRESEKSGEGFLSIYQSTKEWIQSSPPHPVKIYVSTISDSERCSELAWMISLRLEAIFVASSWELPHQEFGKRFCAYLGIATLAKSKG